MSILARRHPGGASPETVTSISVSEPQRTREEYSSTERPTHTRRRILTTLLGTSGLVAVTGGGTLAYIMNRPSHHREAGAPPLPAPEADAPAKERFTRDTLTLPDTTNAATFAETFANVGMALQYYVNNGNETGIANIVPGGHGTVNPLLQPGQFEVRADYVAGYRQSAVGTSADNPNDPYNPRYYAWGFSIEMLELLNAKDRSPQDTDLHEVAAHVRITIGDLPPLAAAPGVPVLATPRPGDQVDKKVEPYAQFETNMVLTRLRGLTAGGTYDYVQDLHGSGIGWGIEVSNMAELPTTMQGANLPRQFSSVPPLYG